MAKIIQLVPVLTMLIVLSGVECSSPVSAHDNAVIQLAKSIKSIELLLRESNSHLKKMASRVSEGADRSGMDQTILRTARPVASGARSASGYRTVYRSKLERIDDSQAKLADDTKSTASSRVKRPASNDNDSSKTIDQIKQERGHKGDDVLAAINTMIKRRYNDNNINTNTNINTNEERRDDNTTENNDNNDSNGKRDRKY
ncbi:hypothetical protein HCN44_010504 [Aphidius gifuensis]|uniref:Venom protein n=1 Tax=Aphidius gifuensis TaxID=684658 RepID=A0A834XSG3_APHGI|nr:FNIP repeat-containing protein DDB_G0290617-like [Aphidius gifuensis]KAF7991703.1 hypothetical protein HCN44_010504 [Aphidius gifuensis]